MGKYLLLEFLYEESFLQIFEEEDTFKVFYNFSPELHKDELTETDIFIEKVNSIIDLLNIISVNHSINLFLYVRELKVIKPEILNSMELTQRFIFKFHERYFQSNFLLNEKVQTSIYYIKENIVEELYFADVYLFQDVCKGKYKSYKKIIHNCIMTEPNLYTKEYKSISHAIRERIYELQMEKNSIQEHQNLIAINQKIELLNTYSK